MHLKSSFDEMQELLELIKSNNWWNLTIFLETINAASSRKKGLSAFFVCCIKDRENNYFFMLKNIVLVNFGSWG